MTLETYDVAMPVEPPLGSVVLTSDGRAWQRRAIEFGGPLWYPADHKGNEPTGKFWWWLVSNPRLRPLTLIYLGQQHGE